MNMFKSYCLMLGCVFFWMVGCQETSPGPNIEPKMGTEVSLTITGYNYTNKYIDEFYVESSSGGNLHVSSPNGGGGSSFCCYTYIMGASLWKPMVRWHVGGCAYNTRKDSYGDVFFDIHRFYRTVEATLNPDIPNNPRYIEVHFYPDGHVETAITALPSGPRLSLSADREDRSPIKPCPNDLRPVTKKPSSIN